VPLGVVFAAGGKIYGSTAAGGNKNNGTVFELSPAAVPGRAWTHTVLYTFKGTSSHYLVKPNAVTIHDGALYGTTQSGGGCNGCGTVFQLSPPAVAGGAWKETVLRKLSALNGDSNLVFDSNGALYGTSGGPAPSGPNGTVFQLTPPAVGGGAWTESVLHQFTGGTDGRFPQSLTWGADGALYGATFEGGSTDCGNAGCGTVYQLAPPAEAGGAWTESILYSFSGTHGAVPNSPLLFDGNGAIYGTTRTGYPSGNGTVFQLAPPTASGDPWTLKTLYDFTGSTYGDGPAGVVFDGSSLDVDVTNDGFSWGSDSPNVQNLGANGAMVQLAPPAVSGGTWIASLMYGFGAGSDGSSPRINLSADSAGNLYGTTYAGGTGLCGYSYVTGCGTVFELYPPKAAGDPWTESVLYSFQGGADGMGPNEAIVDSSGVLFGTTQSGGSAGLGTAFELEPPGAPGGTWTLSVLRNFGNGTNPLPAMAVDGNGALYYATYSGGANGAGVIYQLTPPTAPGGAWTNTDIYGFVGNGGAGGVVSLSFSNGILYGATYGQTPGRASVFRLNPPSVAGRQWTYSAYVFPSGRNNGNPVAIAVGGDGSVYGVTATVKGANHTRLGTVFQLTPPGASGSWTYTRLYTFTDDANPTALVIGGGNLIGGARSAGKGNSTLFQLTAPAAPGGAWTYSTLYSFRNGSPTGLALLNGTLFGTATGGIGGHGSLFEVSF
jgi:uncharacterized repeat protein (TIGR03803 family)